LTNFATHYPKPKSSRTTGGLVRLASAARPLLRPDVSGSHLPQTTNALIQSLAWSFFQWKNHLQLNRQTD
jgi:hypothetical protein